MEICVTMAIVTEIDTDEYRKRDRGRADTYI